jgi:hypothetical protein
MTYGSIILEVCVGDFEEDSGEELVFWIIFLTARSLFAVTVYGIDSSGEIYTQ